MNQRLVFTAILFCILPTTTRAIDLTVIDRSIKKEPSYQTTPGYCLLVFGKEAKTRVWLVVDDKRLYVDRNGNGDLTESDELIELTGSSFDVGQITEADGTTTHTSGRLYLYDRERFRFSINLDRCCRQYVGYGKSSYTKPRLAARPQDAPIIHLNGPMTFARYGPVSFLPRNTEGISYRKTALRVLIGSPGLGEGTFAGYACQALRCEGGYRQVTADVEFPGSDASADPITLRDHLKVRN